MPAEPLLPRGDHERFRRLVGERSGLAIPEARDAQLERAVAAALRDTRLPDAGALYRRLSDPEGGRADLESFITALTVGETHFFRYAAQFETLERHILPDVIARRRDARRLRLWSAGCSSGEEAHSLAILLIRLLPDLAEWDVLVLGTDIDRRALARATQGVYGPWSFRGVPEETRSRHFIPRGRELEVDPRARAIVTFSYLNLADDVYPSLITGTTGVDVILCRNVLMYFGDEAAGLVIGRLHRSLAGGGWLVPGPADRWQELHRRFACRSFAGTIAFQKVAEVPDAPEAPKVRSRRGAAPERAPRPPTRRGTGPDGRRGLRESPPTQGETGADAEVRDLEARAAADPRDGRAPYLAAKVYADRLDLAPAQHWIAEALRRDPLLAPAHLLRALVLEEEGRADEALEALRRCLYADPSWALGYFALAGFLERRGERTRAVKALDTVAGLLAGRPPDEPIPDGDGLAAGQLRQLAEAQRELLLPETAGRRI